ncbi:MAG TPA: hypothetical protein VNQ15_08215 [Verrucomicrobiae bacterium]|nr:hypothetical protein [Verrucomicrobiae bacterium]
MAVVREACPVMKMTSVVGSSFRMPWSTSKPDMSGSVMSTIAASIGLVAAISRPARAWVATWTT